MCIYISSKQIYQCMYVNLQTDYEKVFDNYSSSNDTSNATNVRRALAILEMNKTCKFFTEIMTYKHRLQYHIFHNTNLPSECITKLTELTIYLQSAAMQLQQIKVNKNIMIRNT